MSDGRWRNLVLEGVAVILTILALGELYMRFPGIPPRLEYRPDEDLVGTIAPDQRGYIWMANMSFQSPPITMNREGHRGEETDWSQPVVVTVGSSESWGAGVRDDEVWTERLEARLRDLPGLGSIQVVNAANPGHGPYHQRMVLERLLERHPADAVLVRVSWGDRNFMPPSERQLEAAVDGARFRARIRKSTKFLPFLVNKAQSQLGSLKEAFVPWFLRSGHDTAPGSNPERFWQEHAVWWQDMVRLAGDHGVPLVFMIPDPLALPDHEVIESRLTDLCEGGRRCEVVRLGPEDYDLDVSDPGHERVFRQTLTLVRDPHANARQHEQVAAAMFRELAGMGMPSKILRHHSRRARTGAAAKGS